MWEDPIVKEVRKAGEDLAKKCNYDIHEMAEYLRKRNKEGVRVEKI